ISDEGRAKHNYAKAHNDRDIYKGLTFWSPNINIFRDPRWGRGHETYGEDPFLTAEMGKAFVEGLQTDGEFLKAAACAKHLAVHSGPEQLRHEFNAEVSDQDLYETYLPAFEQLVKEAKVESVMGAYNRFDGEPCCGSPTLLRKILRDDWGFEGHVVSDCGAISDFHTHHMVTADGVESAALALKSGCDLNCGGMYGYLMQALDKGLIDETDLDTAAIRLFTTRYLLGEFEEADPFGDIGIDVLDCPAHQKLNLEMAEKTLVLLKNDESFLPLNADDVKTIAVIGPNGSSISVLEGNYCGTAGEYITLADGIRHAAPNSRVYVAQGSQLFRDRSSGLTAADDRISEAVAFAEIADVTILCVGLDPAIEGEEGDASNEYAAGDKHNLLLPESQQRLVNAVCAASDRIVVVVTAGSAIDLGIANDHAKAIVHAWYPGARGGEAVANLLFGKSCPSGKLPLTFYHNDDPIPEFTDYAMEGRTYRFLKTAPLYPFGYGLSYTSFEYRDLKVGKWTPGQPVTATVSVTNTGKREGDEIVEAYVHIDEPGLRTPNYQLVGFARVSLKPDETKQVSLTLPDYWLKIVSEDGSRIVPSGKITLWVGGHQPDSHSETLCGSSCLTEEIIVE
ncbi:MAG: glycoside hydrolase family 3 C-terminal domain-containing protein, partial [Oscillospiraceae bacterium]|nr:glycoside hydrolase family 3 C-terminal domain-containing protein [Oscillospiraceae bacterium]